MIEQHQHQTDKNILGRKYVLIASYVLMATKTSNYLSEVAKGSYKQYNQQKAKNSTVLIIVYRKCPKMSIITSINRFIFDTKKCKNF